MADALYNDQRNSMFGAWTISFADLNTDTIKALMRDEGTTAVSLAHTNLSQISTAGVGTDQTIASPTIGVVGVGVFDHAIITWSALSGASVESLDYYKDSGVAATSPLIVNIDSATGLPLTPNTGDVTFDPDPTGLLILGA